MTDDLSDFLQRPGRPALAYRASAGAGPTAVWLGGFRSDMTGTKAAALHAAAKAAGRAFLRLDYSGHGESEGAFENGTIGAWAGDARDAITALTEGPLVLVGSSMGGWIALLTALAMPERIAGLVLIAPAPDFTERLMWQGMDFQTRREVMERGRIALASAYDPAPTIVTRDLIEDGRRHLLLDAPIAIRAPVHILHGQADPDVPWRQSLLLAELLDSQDVRLTFVKAGDHRLSRPEDISLLVQIVDSACKMAESPSR